MDPDVLELAQRLTLVEIELAGMRANMEWLIRIAWLVIASNVGSIILSGLQLRRNNNKGRKK